MTEIKNGGLQLCDALPFLPARVSAVINLFCMKYPKMASDITEIRLRLGGALSVSVGDGNVMLDAAGSISDKPYICTKEDVDGCVSLLCRSSFHSHEDELELGYISAPDGIRAGVSTYGVPGGSVYGIDGICLRLPRDVYGCSLGLFEKTGVVSMLICSPPGVGKTTLLRDMAHQLSGKYGKRVVVCDTKYELLPKKKPLLADYICGRNKAAAVECAVRSLSAQAVLCDELGDCDETRALLSAQSGGVVLICTAHADGMKTMLSRPNLRLLYDGGIFEKYVFLSRKGTEFTFDVTDG